MEKNISEEYMKMFGVRENPFTFRILPELFVGHMNEINRLVYNIKSGGKISLLVGPTGSGKTTMMKYISDNLSELRTVYIPKPPGNPEDWVKIFTNFITSSFIERLFSRKKSLNLYNLSEWVNKKLKNERIVMLVDEGHEASMETLEWLRTLSDQIDNLSVVIAGLPSLETYLRKNLETFIRRVNTKLELTNLTKTETRELVKRRIEWAGGEDIKPFTSEVIDCIYEKTGGFPRDVIRICNHLMQKAAERGISTIDSNFIREVEDTASIERNQKLSLSSLDELPSKQRNIIEILAKEEDLTPNEIVKRIGMENYKNPGNAVRSVNNILKRLIKDGYVTRRGKGKSYKYRLSEKTKTLFVNA